MPRIETVTTAGLDDINRQRRHREVTDLMLNFQHDDSRIRTAAEVAAGVTPVNYAYPPGVDLRYGVIRDDSTDNQAALTNLIAVGAQGTQIILTPGIAVHSGTLDWSHSGLRVLVEGASQLRHTGTGAANLIDGGAAGALWNIVIDGYLEELGSANTTYCWDIRAIGRCRLDLRAKDCTTGGARIRFAVTCIIRFGMTGNDGTSITTQPPYGLILNERGVGEQVANCRFPNLFIEGLSSNTGLLLASTFACTFETGTSEGNDVGIEVNGASNYNNTFINFDMESNTTADMTVSGGQNLTLLNCRSTSSTAGANISLTGGDSTTFESGFYRWVDRNGSTNTNFICVQVPDNSGVGIKGTSDGGKILGVVKVDTSQLPVSPPSTGVQYDDVGNTGTFTPTIFGGTTAGTQTYAANGQKGYYTRVGHRVDFTAWINLASNSGGTGDATIGGLPFSSRNQTNCYHTICIGDYTGVTLGAAGRTLAMRIAPGGTTGLLLETDTGSVSNFIAIGSVAGTALIIISGSYMID